MRVNELGTLGVRTDRTELVFQASAAGPCMPPVDERGIANRYLKRAKQSFSVCVCVCVCVGVFM